MREKERIDRILSLMNQIWIKYPDMRFNQLMDVLSWEFANKNKDKYIEYTYSKFEDEKGIHFLKEMADVNLFHVEDDNFEGFLIEYLNGMMTCSRVNDFRETIGKIKKIESPKPSKPRIPTRPGFNGTPLTK